MRKHLKVVPGAAALCIGLLLADASPAQEHFSVFVGSDPENVTRMVKMAELRDGDVVLDLGSGDGRIVLEAARSHPKVQGWGVDIDRELVEKSNAAAREQGVSNRIRFYHRNVFDTDLREATVIFMWLFPELMRMLRPKILAEARPGTRVITHVWDMGSWKPDAIDENGAQVNLWIVPARVEGAWSWELPVGPARHTYTALMEQSFQAAEGTVRAGSRRGIFENMRLRGDEISFTLGMTLDGAGYVRHEFLGKVQGDRILGTARVSREPHKETFEFPWHATRAPKSAYFAPTGVGAK
jgi:hypothetical protein